MNTQTLRQSKQGIFTFLIIFFASFQIFGQSHPPFPNVDEVYKNILNNPSVYKSLKEDYKIANPKDCKIEKKMIIGGGDVIVSDFSTYKSDNANNLNWKWPEDRAYTVFRVTTPENTEGVKYVLPLVVEYTRLQYDAMTSNYHYLWWKFDAPYSVSGGREDALFEELLKNKLNALEQGLTQGARGDFPTDFGGFSKITGIEKSDKKDLREVYSNVEKVSRTYIIKGDCIKYTDRSESEVAAHFIDSKYYLYVVFQRDKDEKGKTGEWYASSFLGGIGTGLSVGTDSGDKQLYQTIGKNGFEAVFQREKTEIELPYFSKKYEEKVSAEIAQIIIDCVEGKDGAEERLKSYLAPGDEELFNKYKEYFDDIRSKFVGIRYRSENPVYVYAKFENEVKYISATIKLERKSLFDDKSLKAVYKAAGMSKQQIAMGGAYSVDFRWRQEVIVIGNQVKIIDAPSGELPIPF